MNKFIKSFCPEFTLILISYFIPNPIAGEILFWLPILIVLIKGNYKSTKEQKISSILLMMFIVLFMINCVRSIPDTTKIIRLYGLTRCIISGQLFFVIFQRKLHVGHIGKENDYIIFVSIALNISYITKLSFIVDLFSINAIACINMIIYPYVLFNLIVNKKLRYVFPFIIIIAELMFFDSETYILGIGITSFVFVVSYNFRLLKTFLFSRKRLLRCAFILFFVIIIIVVYIAEIRNVFINKMIEINADRGYIYRRALNQYLNEDILSQIIGNGDNRVYMDYHIHAGHNMIIELLLIYGHIGFVLSIIEFVIYIRYIRKIKTNMRIMAYCSIVGLYIMFLFHPYYSSFYISKLVFIALVLDYSGGMENIQLLSIDTKISTSS